MGVVAALANFANLLKTCFAVRRTWPFSLSANYYDILSFILGTGRLSQGERRGKEKSLSKKRVPTDRYVLGV